jgi:hypothetical protein
MRNQNGTLKRKITCSDSLIESCEKWILARQRWTRGHTPSRYHFKFNKRLWWLGLVIHFWIKFVTCNKWLEESEKLKITPLPTKWIIQPEMSSFASPDKPSCCFLELTNMCMLYSLASHYPSKCISPTVMKAPSYLGNWLLIYAWCILFDKESECDVPKKSGSEHK